MSAPPIPTHHQAAHPIPDGQAIEQFKAALLGAGIAPPEHIHADGKLHRCATEEGKRGNHNAAYVLHLDGVPAGGYQNHQDGAGWQNWRANIGRPYTAEESKAYRTRIDADRKQRKAEEAQRHADAAKLAGDEWSKAKAAQSHPYLERKGITGHGLRVRGGLLVVPMRDTDGQLHSLQTIAADGAKRFQAGGRKLGCFFTIGQIEPEGVLCIVEGFATGASVHEATGHAVAVAFDAGNLLPVAQAIRAKYPELRLAICADDDYQTAGNTGIAKGREAAKMVGAVLVVPDFDDTRPDGATDFNDLHQAQGLDAVADCVQVALAGKPEPVEATPAPERPAKSAKPLRHDYQGGAFEVSTHGVFFLGKDKDGNEQSPKWICSPLSVVAMTRDNASGEWGRLLRWQDSDGVAHQWAMPLELLQGDGLEVRRELTRLGLQISPTKAARDLLGTYLQVWPAKARARCVERLGWHGAVYVTPSETMGETDEITVFQSAHAIEPAASVAGTLTDWRDSVARLAAGNSRMVFAISAAFAGVLAELLGEDGGGFHLRGASSSGKSTALKLAASVWGSPKRYMRLWRTTANGLEGLAALHNDGLLILDELSQIDPREAGEAAYLLANGQGKTRAGKTGAARAAAQWRLLFLSAGEETLAAIMGKAGKSANTGQEVRLADIEADAGAGMGAFEVIHEHASPAALATVLGDASGAHYGAAGVEWVRHVVANRAYIVTHERIALRQWVQRVCPADAAGQVQRVARRFALVARAGELATAYGLTGWQAGEAETAAHKCFTAWLDGFGGAGNKEERNLLAQVESFFARHGRSRFENEQLSESYATGIRDRAGFVRTTTNGATEYKVFCSVFDQEVCQGFDSRAAAKTLIKTGWLIPARDGRPTHSLRIARFGKNRARFYVFAGRAFETDDMHEEAA